MVPEDDARSTIELSDRYVILPSHNPEKRAAYLAEGATPLPDGFSYCSDKNPERLDARGLQGFLAQAYGR